jgi:uncharacterized membrane protein
MRPMKKSPIALRSNLAAGALLAVGVVTLVYLVEVVRGFGLLQDVEAGHLTDPSHAMALFERIERLEWVQMGSWVLAAVMLAFWMPAALRGARELGAQGMRFRYGWPWFIVPIANFFVPYQAMKELWQTSHAGPDESINWWSRAVPRMLPIWWTIWILTYLASLTMRHKSDPTNLEEALSLYRVAMVHGLFLLVYLTLTFLLVRRVAAAQAERIADPMPAARVVG